MENKKNRQFGFVVGGMFLLITVYFSLVKHRTPYGLAIIGCLLITMAIFTPSFLNLMRKAWTYIGNALGRVNSYVILTIIFFLLFVPVNFILRIFGKDLLELKIKRNEKSYWKMKETGNNTDMKFQF